MANSAAGPFDRFNKLTVVSLPNHKTQGHPAIRLAPRGPAQALEREQSRTDDKRSAPRIVILFDACAPKMEECISSQCENDPAVLCKHRFKFDFYVLNGIHGQNYLSSVMLLDFQAILHFLYFIFQNRVPGPKNSKYVFITKDKKFLQSVQKEWQEKAKKRTRPRLSFGSNYIRNGRTVIYVECINSKAYGSDRCDDRKAIIDQLNERFGHPAS